jgi:hypothetical protein
MLLNSDKMFASIMTDGPANSKASRALFFKSDLCTWQSVAGRAYHHPGVYDQLDRSPDFESGGCGFESRHAGHTDKKSRSLKGQ